MADLEITSNKRKAIIKELSVQDFSDGLIEEVVFMGSPMWIFGKEIKGKEIYIKISMGFPSKQTLCISFHVAEFSMIYPFKTSSQNGYLKPNLEKVRQVILYLVELRWYTKSLHIFA